MYQYTIKLCQEHTRVDCTQLMFAVCKGKGTVHIHKDSRVNDTTTTVCVKYSRLM